MSESDVNQQVRDALKQSGGNIPKAQRLLLSKLENDKDLLYGLAAPHLRSLVGYAIQQEITRQDEAATGQSEQDTPRPDAPTKESPAATAAKAGDVEISTFGMELLHNMTGGARLENFGFVSEDVAAPQKTSGEHISAILKIAKKQD